MRKIFLISILMLLISGLCHAEETAIQEYSYVLNNSSTISGAITAIPTTSIRPGVDKITAYSVMAYDTAKNAELYAALYDSTATALDSQAEVIGEREADNSNGGASERFGRPQKFVNGIVVNQGINTSVVIKFIKQ